MLYWCFLQFFVNSVSSLYLVLTVLIMCSYCLFFFMFCIIDTFVIVCSPCLFSCWWLLLVVSRRVLSVCADIVCSYCYSSDCVLFYVLLYCMSIEICMFSDGNQDHI